MSLCDKLKIARSHLDKSQKEMAEMVGAHSRSWQGYERGTNTPGGKVFEALLELGFNLSWFYSDDVPMLLATQAKEANGTTDLHMGREEQPAPAPTGSDLQAMPSDSLGLGESVELLAKIYNSGNTVLVRAIAANLNAFSEAIDNKALAIDMKKRMVGMEQRITALEEKLTQATAAPPQKAANG